MGESVGYSAVFLPSACPATLQAHTCTSYNFRPSALCSAWGGSLWHPHRSGKVCRRIQASLPPFPSPTVVCHPPKALSPRAPEGPPFMGPLIFFIAPNMSFISVTTGDLGAPEGTASQQCPGPQVTPSAGGSQVVFFVIYLFVCLFVYLIWLRQAFIAAPGLSLVAASLGYSSLQCAGFSF